MSELLPPHMSAEEFRRHGRAVIDWIADYLEHVERYPVMSPVRPGEIRALLPERAPSAGEPFERVLRDVDEIILPGITHWQSPGFFGFFPANNSYSSILGELLSAGLGVQGMLWATSPACTELETLVLDWLVDMLGLPAGFRSDSTRRSPAGSGIGGEGSSSPGGGGGGGGVIQDTASSATLCAMLAARERATGGESNRMGVRQRLVAYASAQAHSSVEKAARIAGIGSGNLRLIETDASHAMRVDRLCEAIERDIDAGLVPFFVGATVGTTSSLAVDPVRAIGEMVCEVFGQRGSNRTTGPSPQGRGERSEPPAPPWLHVDAAMAGAAALCPEFRWIHDGLEYADSYCFNPHKWMLTNFDCDCFWVRDRAALIRALSILPEYLRNKATESGAVIDYRDWQIPLGRRFRALKLWFVIRHYGVEGLQAHVRRGVEMARWLREQVERHPDFELAAPATLNLVCLRHRGGDAVNQRILDAVNGSGRSYITHTRLDGKLTLRVAVGAWRTRPDDVTRLWGLVVEISTKTQSSFS